MGQQHTKPFNSSMVILTAHPFLLQPSYGPVVKNCILSNTGDDGITAHGLYEMVAKVIPSTRTVTVAYWSCPDVSCLPIAVGDSMLMYAADFRNLGSATVRSIVQAVNPRTVNGTSSTAPAVSPKLMAFLIVLMLGSQLL